jgi:hypothetical protein
MKGEKMSRIIYQGQLDGEFEGFDDEQIFKMSNGTYWIQAHYKYWYHYAYRPEAIITEEHGRYYLSVANEKIEVRKLNTAIETKINGEFKGWEGETSYVLMNGQKWKQAEYKYEYKYEYSPDVVIYEGFSGTYMHVAGTKVKVKRIK